MTLSALISAVLSLFSWLRDFSLQSKARTALKWPERTRAVTRALGELTKSVRGSEIEKEILKRLARAIRFKP